MKSNMENRIDRATDAVGKAVAELVGREVEVATEDLQYRATSLAKEVEVLGLLAENNTLKNTLKANRLESSLEMFHVREENIQLKEEKKVDAETIARLKEDREDLIEQALDSYKKESKSYLMIKKENQNLSENVRALTLALRDEIRQNEEKDERTNLLNKTLDKAIEELNTAIEDKEIIIQALTAENEELIEDFIEGNEELVENAETLIKTIQEKDNIIEGYKASEDTFKTIVDAFALTLDNERTCLATALKEKKALKDYLYVQNAEIASLNTKLAKLTSAHRHLLDFVFKR